MPRSDYAVITRHVQFREEQAGGSIELAFPLPAVCVPGLSPLAAWSSFAGDALGIASHDDWIGLDLRVGLCFPRVVGRLRFHAFQDLGWALRSCRFRYAGNSSLIEAMS